MSGTRRVHATAAVDDALAALRERWGQFRVVDREWSVSPATYDATVARFERGSVGGAGAWVRRERDGEAEALVVRESDRDGWAGPGGAHEPGESLAETARRETREEAGVDCSVTGVVLAQRAVHVAPERPPLPRLVVAFAADYDDGRARPNELGVGAVRWVRDHPDELAYPLVADYPL
ncbi:MAG: NUDIX hydrolase [Halolamina sp.]